MEKLLKALVTRGLWPFLSVICDKNRESMTMMTMTITMIGIIDNLRLDTNHNTTIMMTMTIMSQEGLRKVTMKKAEVNYEWSREA